MAEYHEAFWIGVATASPVIFLSAVVAIGRTLEFIPVALDRKDTTAYGAAAALFNAAAGAFAGGATYGALRSLLDENDAQGVHAALIYVSIGIIALLAGTSADALTRVVVRLVGVEPE